MNTRACSTEVEGTKPLDPESKVKELAVSWRSGVADATRDDAVEAAARTVSLGDIHPGGLAALYSDKPTLLSNLIRESEALKATTADVSALAAFAEKIRLTYGDVTVHFAAGLASWGGTHPATNVPVLLRPLSLEVDGPDGLRLTLQPGVDVNSRLLAQLATSGVRLDPDQLGAVLRGPHGFSPAAALELIEEAGQSLPDFKLDNVLSMGVFTHPASAFYRELGATEKLAASSVVSALAGHDASTLSLDVVLPEPDPGDRDPWLELGLGDQTPSMLDVVEVVAGGSSTLIKPGPTTDVLGAVTSYAGALASVGKTVLVVADDEASRVALMERLQDSGVSSVSTHFDGTAEADRQAGNDLANALEETESTLDMERLEEVRTSLRRTRETLSSYASHLHERFEEWGVSAFDALQVLTDLTSLPNPPSTRVRLGKDALSKLTDDSGLEARSLLEEAADCGVFSRSAGGAWQGVDLEDMVQATRIVSEVADLAEDVLPAVQRQIDEAAEEANITSAPTIASWRAQLDQLDRARSVLDTFTREIFETSPADLIVATAPASWRKERRIDLKRSRRRQLVNQAKDLVRPGVHVADLNAELMAAQSVRNDWVRATGYQGQAPTIPPRLDEYREDLEKLESHLRVVKPYIEPVYGDLDTLHLRDLQRTLQNLANDTDGAQRIPEQSRILAALDEVGLTELVADLQARRVPKDDLGGELDLAWWASALGYMLAAEPRLGGFDAAFLQDKLSQFRSLDTEHLGLLGDVVVDRVKARRAEALGLYPDQENALREALNRDENAASLFGAYSLSWDLLPIVVAGPAVVPKLVSLGHQVDTVLTLGLDGVSAGMMAPILARGRSVVALDLRPRKTPDGEEVTWLDDLGEVLPTLEVPGSLVSTNPVLASVLARYDKDSGLVGVPSPFGHGPIAFVYAGETDGFEDDPGKRSKRGEESIAVDQLITALQDGSAAVVTLSDRHAMRVRDELSQRMSDEDGVADLVSAAGGLDSVVLGPRALMEARPKRVILSVGVTKTHMGTVIHDFGILSSPDGLAAFEQIARGTPAHLTLVSSLHSSDLERRRLHHEGSQALADLLERAEQENAVVDTPFWPVVEQAPDELLVDLADRLHGLGLNVVPNVGSEGSVRIPLAIGHPEVPDRLLVAVLTDDQEYLEEPSLRTRDRHQVEMLEDAGWRVRTQLSMAVFIDPNHEADRIVDLVLDAVDRYYVEMGLPKTPKAAALLAAGDGDFPQDSNPPEVPDSDAEASEPSGVPEPQQPGGDEAVDDDSGDGTEDRQADHDDPPPEVPGYLGVPSGLPDQTEEP